MKADSLISKLIIGALFIVVCSCDSNKSIVDVKEIQFTPHDPIPEDNATQVPLAVVLSWKSEGAQSFTVRLDTVTPPLRAFIKNINVTHQEIGDLSYNADYYWMITAEFESGDSVNSEIWHFETADISVDSTSVVSFGFPRIEATVENRSLIYMLGRDTTFQIDTLHYFIDDYLPSNMGVFPNLVHSNDTIYFAQDTTTFEESMLGEGWIAFNFAHRRLDVFYHYHYSLERLSEPIHLLKDFEFTIEDLPFTLTGDHDILALLRFAEFQSRLGGFQYAEERKEMISDVGPTFLESRLRVLQLLNFENNGEMIIRVNF